MHIVIPQVYVSIVWDVGGSVLISGYDPLTHGTRWCEWNTDNTYLQLHRNSDQYEFVGEFMFGQPSDPIFIHADGSGRPIVLQACEGMINSANHVWSQQNRRRALADVSAQRCSKSSKRRVFFFVLMCFVQEVQIHRTRLGEEVFDNSWQSLAVDEVRRPMRSSKPRCKAQPKTFIF